MEDITYDDFDEDDLEVLEAGCYQLLPESRDRSGRGVVVVVRNNDHGWKSWKCFVSCILPVVMGNIFQVVKLTEVFVVKFHTWPLLPSVFLPHTCKIQNFCFLFRKARTMWYLYMNALQNDPEVQRRGLVDVVYHYHTNHSIPKYLMQTIPNISIFEACPFRWVAFHYCCPDTPLMKYPISMLKGGLGPQSRQRFRCHYGE